MTSPMPPSFTITRFKPGYAIDQVDAFLATIGSRTAEEINAVQFRTTRFKGGYDEEEVDAYLDACIAHKRRAESSI
jgi:DivIVA domain-containing protein